MNWKQVDVTTYDRVFIDPTHKLFHAEMLKAVDAANKNYKARLVRPIGYKEIFQSESGRLEANGGGVNNSSGTNTTSQLGFAWWSDVLGHKHVRIISGRRRADGMKVNSIFGAYSGGKPDFWCVYPGKGELVKINGKQAVILTCACGKKGNIKELGWDGNQCFACRAVDKYEAETGFRPAVGKKL